MSFVGSFETSAVFCSFFKQMIRKAGASTHILLRMSPLGIASSPTSKEFLDSLLQFAGPTKLIRHEIQSWIFLVLRDLDPPPPQVALGQAHKIMHLRSMGDSVGRDLEPSQRNWSLWTKEELLVPTQKGMSSDEEMLVFPTSWGLSPFGDVGDMRKEDHSSIFQYLKPTFAGGNIRHLHSQNVAQQRFQVSFGC